MDLYSCCFVQYGNLHLQKHDSTLGRIIRKFCEEQVVPIVGGEIHRDGVDARGFVYMVSEILIVYLVLIIFLHLWFLYSFLG